MTTPQPSGTPADPTQQPPAGTPAPSGAPTPTPTPATPPAGEALPSEALTLEEAKKLRQEHNALRKRVAEYEAQAQAAEQAKLSETERLQMQLASAQEQIAALQVEQQSYRLAREIARVAPSLNLIDPDAAMLMLQAGGELEYDDEGHPKNVAKLLEKLVAEKPYLIASNVTRPTPPPSSGGATNPGRSAMPQGQPQPARADPKAAYAAHRQGGGLANPNIWKR